jgi:hypothetical protein
MRTSTIGKATGAVVLCLVAPATAAATARLAQERQLEYATLQADLANRKWFAGVAGQTFRRAASILPTDRDPLDVALRRTRALLTDVAALDGAPDLSADAARLDALSARAKRTDVRRADDRRRLFEQLVALRRRIAFAHPLLDFDEVLFIKRNRARKNHMCDQFFGFNASPGGGLFVLNDPFGEAPTVRDVLAGAVLANGRREGQPLTGGSFLAPDLRFDGRRIVFAHTECRGRGWSPTSSFHLFAVNVDGGDLRQLTDGKWNDFDPCWLPNGRVAFISERRGGEGRCHGRPCPSYTLHSVRPDGGDLVVLSWHETNEWQPSVNHDGMIVYTRWDYVDRGTNQAHHPWVTSPDGRDARSIHGNFPDRRELARRPWMEMDVRAIPGSQRYVATAAPHHGQAYGSFVVLDGDVEDDNAASQLKRLTPEERWPEAERGRQAYATAWPLSEDYYLCVYAPRGARGNAGTHGIYLLDSFGNRELLYRDAEIACLSPIPLRARPVPPALPHLTAVGKPPAAAEGPKHTAGADAPATIALMNVYDGLLDWPEGTRIEALRIIHLIPKVTVGLGRPAVGYGHKTNVRQVIGTVPVESDGSAYFQAPVDKGIYFQALGPDGAAVQSMRSLTYVHPGERLACQGCHERRYRTPSTPAAVPLALRRAPSKVRPETVPGAHPFNYVRLVQPVLDDRCIRCHGGTGKARLDLRGRPGGRSGWTTSYSNLQRYVAYYDSPKPWNATRTVPGQFGANASKLYRILQSGHEGVKLTPAEMHRIVLWLDCNAGFYGAYLHTAEQAAGKLVEPSLD